MGIEVDLLKNYPKTKRDLTKRLEEKEAKAEKPVKVEIDVNKFQKDSAKWNANFFLIVFPILFVLVYIMSAVGGAR